MDRNRPFTFSFSQLFAAVVDRDGVQPGFKTGQILKVFQIAVHANEGFLRHFHCQIVVKEKLVPKVVDALVPKLHHLPLGILVPLAGPG
jgi:hypothetical protein